MSPLYQDAGCLQCLQLQEDIISPTNISIHSDIEIQVFNNYLEKKKVNPPDMMYIDTLDKAWL